MRREEDETEAIVKGLAQQKWEDTVKATSLESLGLDAGTMALLRVYFELGHNSGQAVIMDTLREIYENDIDMFESFFEVDESNILH